MTTSIEIYSREEIITDVLLIRLPVKSLLRFKCVCKSWHDLMKYEGFIKKHFNSASNVSRLCICLAGRDCRPSSPFGIVNFYLFPDKLIPGIIPSNQRILGYLGAGVYCGPIYGPLDGLFLSEEGGYLCEIRYTWWNSATKQCRVIPRVEFELQQYFEGYKLCAVAMGYDAVTKDYKVVTLRTFFDGDLKSNMPVYPRTYCAVYSRNNDSWKHIEPDFHYDDDLRDSFYCTHINGVYYWLCFTKDNTHVITTFEFTTESFGQIEAPPIPSDQWAMLMIRGESLALMYSHDESLSHYDIWAMIRQNNWIKVVTVNPLITGNTPIGIWGYDKYIYEDKETHSVVCYDHTINKVIDFGINVAGLTYPAIYPLSYRESLVPLNRENPGDEDNIDYYFRRKM